MPANQSTPSSDPAAFPHRVLFTVSGLTPQIVTETLYYLAVREDPAFIPTRIVVATTSQGAEHLRLRLLGGEPGWLARLCRDYNLPPIRFTEADIRVLPGPDGAPLADIRSAADNAAAADGITKEISTLTADPDCALHVSMAGGRKTLGFFAAYALSLYGRPQDRLSHVLVSEAFENNPAFFYPTPDRVVINDRNGKPLDASQAEVTLAPIPFVCMRYGLPEALLSGRASYNDAVTAVQRLLEPPRLVLDLRGGRAVAGRVDVELQPRLLAFYAWMARKRLAGEVVHKAAAEDDDTRRQHAAEFLAGYRALAEREIERTELDTMRQGLDYAWFSQTRSRVNARLEQVLGAAAERYLVKRFGEHRREYSFGLDLPPEAISIVEG